MAFGNTYSGKTVLVTGHTGFKGSWLCEWLLSLGANLSGLALPPETEPALFDQLGLASRMDHRLGDIRDLDVVREVVGSIKPDFVFHLAAQPLVRLSYEQPVGTFATNVLGTIHMMEAVRLSRLPCAFIAVTTDKCYENREWLHAYREEDPMGGHDPYSASKGAAELAVSCYRRSYFSEAASGVKLASVRAGNVIGGGDWAVDRIIPDAVRALQAGQEIPVRNPSATRPWQHVLEPLSGYLHLAACLFRTGKDLCGAYNFGPALTSNQSVARLMDEVLLHWQGAWADRSRPDAPHEAQLLSLSTDKAYHLLGWQPVWDFAETAARTIRWYRQAGTVSALELTQNDISAFSGQAGRKHLPWSI